MEDETVGMERHCAQCGTRIPAETAGSVCPACAAGTGEDETSAHELREGSFIDRYRINTRIGSGGFGVVYLAHQIEPVRRKVALKVLRRAQLNERAVARFLGEQQALALMNHPNIAKIFDAGETAWGAPYFAMELIAGEPISRYCDRKKLDLRARVGLFREVCRGIQHAHLKGVIHCDLKPANVLVTEIDDRPVPKIIDFGVASTLGIPLREEMTGLGIERCVGTPEYMPPEQARGDADVDTRADIYSLGIILYELLTGRPPFSRDEVRGSGIAAMIDKIEAERPPTPSEVLHSMDGDPAEAEIARRRHLPPGALRKIIRGDLDWIVMKAIEKQRHDRYESAGALADDIDRYLSDRPLPGPDRSLSYRARKFAARHRPLVWSAASAAVVVALAATLAVRAERRRSMDRGATLRDALFTSRVESLPSVIASLDGFGRPMDDLLRSDAADDSRTSEERARASLALLSRDPAAWSRFAPWLLEAPPRELSILLPMLPPWKSELEGLAWNTITDPATGEDRRLHAAALGAAANPSSARWPDLADSIAGELVSLGPYAAQHWIPLLRPVADHLEPPLMRIFTAHRGTRTGEVAALVLAEFASGDPTVLASLARVAAPRQLQPISEAMSRMADAAEPIVGALLDDGRAAGNLSPEEAARLATSLFLMGRPDRAWELLDRTPDQAEARSRLVAAFSAAGVDPDLLARRIGPATPPGRLHAALLALGDYDLAQLPIPDRAALRPAVAELFVSHPDPGVRSAAEWLLRTWNLADDLGTLEAPLRTGRPEDGRRWFLTRNGDFTMAVFTPPLAFEMGAGEGETGAGPDEHRHAEEIPRPFAIATKEVTVDQFMAFAEAMKVRNKTGAGADGQPWGRSNPVSRTGDSPAGFISAKEAMLFCWWLTREEGLAEDEHCYRFDGREYDDADVVTREGFLLRRGYRLPTEAEWEFACRAGTTTPRPFGSSDELLHRFAWFLDESREPSRPVGRLRPNDFGLFDMLGNLCEWCQEPYQEQYRTHPDGLSFVVDDHQMRPEPREDRWFVYRGGSYFHPPKLVRSAWRNCTPFPAHPFNGFRVARTLGPEELE